MDTEIIEEATKGGWCPQEEWKGDPDKWVDAKTFVERGEKFAGQMKQQRDELHNEVESLKSEISKQQESFAEFQKFTEEARKREIAQLEKDHQSQLKSLKEQKKEALKDGDADRVIELDDEIDDLKDVHKKSMEEKASESKEDKSTDKPDDRIFQEWVKENEWYTNNVKLRSFANGYGGEIEGKYVGKEFLDKILEKVKSEFPEEFENKNRDRSDVEGGSGGNHKKGKTYDDLPQEAKQACDKFVKTIPGFTVEKYLKDYEWE
jgi:hypothetical protein